MGAVKCPPKTRDMPLPGPRPSSDQSISLVLGGRVPVHRIKESESEYPTILKKRIGIFDPIQKKK